MYIHYIPLDLQHDIYRNLRQEKKKKTKQKTTLHVPTRYAYSVARAPTRNT